MSSEQIQTEVLVDTVLKTYFREKKIEEKKEQDKRLRNTKLLLRNYQTFKRYSEKHEGDKDIDRELSTQQLILNSEDLVQSIRLTTERTLLMIQHLDKALQALDFICQQELLEDKATGKQYEILKKRYVIGETVDAISSFYSIGERTVYKAIDAGAERLSVLLFGVYGLKVE